MAVSYDAPATLGTFAGRQGITYPLLSDEGSKVIDLWGLRNQSARGREAGIPYPGTFILDRSLQVLERAFEGAYQERSTAAGLLARIGGAVPPAATGEVAGGQIVATIGVSDSVVSPGERVTLIVDITPRPRMHVYAPGQQGYIPLKLELTASVDFKADAPRFPASRDYYFAPLRETVKVFDRPLRVTETVTIALTPELRRRAAAKEALVISGSLSYQACDDKVCYRQETLPLVWTMTLAPFVR
jgi:hypothetical protein